MPIQFIWDESYETGDATIDRQHQRIFELANGLNAKLEPVQVRQIILDLHRHVQENLATEEILMREAQYPKADDHRSLHEQLLKRLITLGDDVLSGEWSPDLLQKLIYDWIVDDIIREDTEFFAYLKQDDSAETNANT